MEHGNRAAIVFKGRGMEYEGKREVLQVDGVERKRCCGKEGEEESTGGGSAIGRGGGNEKKNEKEKRKWSLYLNFIRGE